MDGTVRVKICGLTRPEDVAGAVAAGAGYLGFVFHQASPRGLSVAAARALALEVPPGVAKVALLVDPDDARLDEVTARVPLDMLQLHGAEPPERVAEIRARTGLAVIKAVGIAGAEDLVTLDLHAQVADMLLVDAKPPRGADRPGGHGVAFDWDLLAGRRWGVPWLLAGGLTPSSVGAAVQRTGARQVDVSSGVERAPGVKDHARMAAFVAAAQGGPGCQMT